jgi:DNA-binding response OmpR family regulator
MNKGLAGKRILVVEDEYFIATDVKDALRKQGATVIGPVADLEQGLALAADDSLDGAVLDVNLEGAQTFPIADLLMRASVPFVFVTGYDAWALPEPYRGAPRIAKPIAMKALLATIERLVVLEPTE